MLQLKYKNSFSGYFQFYYAVIGYRIYSYILLNILIGLLDGIGLAMFVPLLALSSNNHGISNTHFQSSVMEVFANAMSRIHLPFTIISVLIILIVLFSAKGFIRFLQVRYLANMRLLFITKLREGVVDDLQKLSYKGFLKLDAGRIQNTLVGEVMRLYDTMTNYFNSIQFGAMLLTYLTLAFLANYQFSFLIVGGSICFHFLYKHFFAKTKKVSIEVSQKGNYFNSYLIQSIVHFKYLKATNYFKKYAVKLKKVIQETEVLNFKMGHYQAITDGLKEPIAVIIICIVIFLQVQVLGRGLEGIMICLLLFYRSLIQFTMLQSSWQSFTQSVGSMYALSSIVSEIQSAKEYKIEEYLQQSIKTIRLENISIEFPSNIILNKINLHITANTTVAFVGHSGSGKTSLINVMMGLLPPSSGDIFINEKSLKEINLNNYRDRIGYISQDVVIFNESIFNNITFFDMPTTANTIRFWEALAMASLTDFVQSLPQKENSVLGDNGILISGGQKQRISIARELYKKPELLVLDEATSSLDTETENIVKQSIQQLKGQCTILIIAHRLSTIKDADIIYLLGNKEILTSGNFEELINNSTQFKNMVMAQQF